MESFKVLFATNFQKSAFDSLQSLLPLKRVGLEEIILTHIISREDVAYVPYGGYMKDRENSLLEEARLRFEDWRKILSQEGIKSRVYIEVGHPIPKIVKIAETEEVKLIVAGHKKRTDEEKVYIGSHTLELLRRSRAVPVLINNVPDTYHPGEEWSKPPNESLFSRPLLATDWSEISNKILGFITSVKDGIDRADIVHVIGAKILKDWDKEELKRLELKSQDSLAAYERVLKKAGIYATAHLMAGKPVEEILRLSYELKSTMIILGTTGKDRIAEFFLGSVSHRIAEISDRPTLLIP